MIEWRKIEGYEASYEINNLGQVRRIAGGSGAIRGTILKDGNNGRGYRYVSLYKGNVRRNYYIHILLAKAFIPNPEDKPQVNHRNGLKHDNRIENLEWVTLSEQMRHAYSLGLLRPPSKLRVEEVVEIRRLHKEGVPRPRLAETFNVSKAQIHRIVHGELWCNVA